MKTKHGFTLVEIMIVVAIIGLLIAIGIPGFLSARSNARKNSCYNNMRIIAHAIQQYTIDRNKPADSQCDIYSDVIMPSGTARNPELYVPSHLQCPEGSLDYSGTGGNPVNNTNLDVTCPAAAARSHGTYGDIIK